MTKPEHFIQIEIKPFDALTLLELHACLKLRGEVFVVGQQICAVPDVDEYDPMAFHVMLWIEGAMVGTARLLASEDGTVVKVGRVAIAGPYRGRGHGSRLMQAIHAWLSERPDRTGLMHAQAYLANWYESLGWSGFGTIFMEAGIEHLEMRYTPKNSE